MEPPMDADRTRGEKSYLPQITQIAQMGREWRMENGEWLQGEGGEGRGKGGCRFESDLKGREAGRGQRMTNVQ